MKPFSAEQLQEFYKNESEQERVARYARAMKLLDEYEKSRPEHCLWRGIDPKDRNRPIGLACPCTHCTTWC